MIKLVNVSKYYHSNNIVALGLRKVNLELHTNEFVAIVGESGSGKTTLLNVICGIDTYEEGEMYLNGEETSYYSISEMENYRKKYVAFVFQNYNLIESYTVLQNVEAPLIFAGLPKQEVRRRALEIIKRVGLEKHIHHKATKLSGGQKQRVVIARALAKDCPIIAADEPTGNLDSASGEQILALLHEISKEKLVILVTHDYDQVKQYATRKVRLYDGEIVEDLEVTHPEKKDIPKLDEKENKLSVWNQILIALRNLASVPKKTLLMIFVFTFFSFFVALAYGGFNASLRDLEESYNSFFNNTSISRVVVRKYDKSPFTTLDLAELRGRPNVRGVITHDFWLEYNVGMFSGNDEYTSDFINTSFLPIGLITASDLIGGRMPIADDEVVLAISENSNKSVEDLTFRTYKFSQWEFIKPSVHTELTVVGVIYASQLYMDAPYSTSAYMLITPAVEEEYRVISYQNYITQSIFTGVNHNDEDVRVNDFFAYVGIAFDETVADDIILMPDSYKWTYCGEGATTCSATGDLYIKDFYREITVENMDIGFFSNATRYAFLANSNTINKMFGFDEIYQVSVITSTDVGVPEIARRITTIRNGVLPKYKVFYPYMSQTNDPYMAVLILFNIIAASVTLGFTLISATLVTYLIFRAIINTKLATYAIFRTIGANKRMITKLIYLENIASAVIGYIFLVIILLLFRRYVPFLFDILKYYDIIQLAILFIIIFIMALLISSRYCRKIFTQSVHTTLKLE